MEGKVVLITGSTSGLGLHTAKELYSMGAKVVLTCRDEIRGRKAVEEVCGSSSIPNDDRLHLLTLDLMCYKSILNFCHEFHAHFDKLDVLICNAGVMGKTFELSSDGIEAHFATNMFGHFVVVCQLFDLLENASGRIVVVSSGLYKEVNSLPSLKQIMGEQTWDYNSRYAYALSKLANCLFTTELSRRLSAIGSLVKVYALRPGFVRGTELGRETHWLARRLAAPVIWLFSRSLDQGVEPIVFCSKTNGDELVSDQLYNVNCQAEDFGPMVNEVNSSWLWSICCQMEDLVLKRGRHPDDFIAQIHKIRSRFEVA